MPATRRPTQPVQVKSPGVVGFRHPEPMLSALVVATVVSIDGTREVLGTALGDSESCEFWREYLSSLKAHRLSGGVHLVISDAHAGLKITVVHQFTKSSWHRCRVHFMRNQTRHIQGTSGCAGRPAASRRNTPELRFVTGGAHGELDQLEEHPPRTPEFRGYESSILQQLCTFGVG